MEEKDFEAKLRSVNEVKFPLVKAKTEMCISV